MLIIESRQEWSDYNGEALKMGKGVRIAQLAGLWMMKYNASCTGRGSARIECTVRVREVGGSNPPAPTEKPSVNDRWFFCIALLLVPCFKQ
jgi:hypothetical protein